MIPDAAKQVLVQAQVSGAAARRHEAIAGSAAAVSDAVKGDAVIAGMSVMAGIPHIAILLPLVIPLVALIADKTEKMYRHKASSKSLDKIDFQY